MSDRKTAGQIDLIPVRSSNLRAVGYDAHAARLEIRFHGGRVYQYTRVPSRIYDRLLRASSHGKFFHANIRSRYSFRPIK